MLEMEGAEQLGLTFGYLDLELCRDAEGVDPDEDVTDGNKVRRPSLSSPCRRGHAGLVPGGRGGVGRRSDPHKPRADASLHAMTSGSCIASSSSSGRSATPPWHWRAGRSGGGGGSAARSPRG